MADFDGACIVEYLPKRDIESIRKKSQSPNKGAWVDSYEQMARKSAIKRLFKRIPHKAFDESCISGFANEADDVVAETPVATGFEDSESLDSANFGDALPA